MTYKLGNFESLGLQLHQFTGATTTDDLASAARHDLDGSNRPIGVKFIVDVTDAELDISYENMNRSVTARKIDAGRKKSGKMAIVASNSRNFGITRMYQLISEDAGLWEECSVFNTMDEARTWLNIPAEADLSF